MKGALIPITPVLVLLFAFLVLLAHAAPPVIQRQMEIFEATIEGGGPATIDPAAAYDTASGELLMNMYDTLVSFDGEHLDRYLPQLADNWTIENITGTTSPDGLPWYFRYTFHIRPNVRFWDGNTLTPEDVEYCFERGMVLEPGDNPQWMFYEPLLNTYGALGLNRTTLEGNSTEQARLGAIIDHSVECNSTYVWFNMAFPGAYAPFMQILSQPWSSICSKAWALGLGRASNWDGNWSDWYNHWLGMRYAVLPPFDDPTPVAMGTGPFAFEELNTSQDRWSVLRNHDYWRGWPLDWPSFASSKPAGYIERFVATWAYDWNARSTMFLNGEVDICAIPRQFIGVILNQPNIRCTYPLPSLACDAHYYQFDIAPTSPYGPIFGYGVLGETGVPRDFFGNATYGAYIRKAFTHCVDYNNYIQTVFLGEAVQPATCLIPALPYYNASIPKYAFDLAAAEADFKQWPGLWETGFTIKILYNIGTLARQTLCESIANNVDSLNPKFHVQAVGIDWASYLDALREGQSPVFAVDRTADYPDPHNFVYPYYDSSGNFAARAHYNNPTMDALIDAGIKTPDGPARAEIYSQVQQLAVEDCPSIVMASAVRRHFEQTWVCGWYYNPAYPGVYAANLWKWYYTPHAQLGTVTNATANVLPYDVNYDGKVNMSDIGMAVAGFGAAYGPPIRPRWVYRCDFNNDRKIDMRDIAGIAKNLGTTSSLWTPSS